MRIFFAVALVFPLTSCSSYTRSEINEYLQPYFDGLNEGIYKPEGFSYSQTFERKLETEEWKKAIEFIWQQYGGIENTRLVLVRRSKSIAGESSGIKYRVYYVIDREFEDTIEHIEIFESNRSKGDLEIISHIIMPTFIF